MKLNKNSVITYTNESIICDGKPWFPIMGEIHFSRYPHEYWEEELCKMKSGGVDVVSLYVIWIHHEEEQGVYDFEGDKDLHKFLETVQKCGLYCILRIGPWAHGEARNGGFPDWLLEDSKNKKYDVRSNDPEYLEHVRRFYTKTYEQAKGLLLKDGGPVIGVQIENEYGHCGGFGGEKGEEHMRTLHDMALEIGYDVPIYTATGWGGAVTGGMMPVMGGYCEAPWDQRLTEIEPSGNYIFTKERNDHNIGSDHGLGAGITFDMDKFPYLTAELGGGLQVTRHRRCIASGTDTGAMSMVKLGSGVTLLGYYMYHGGTNPEGKFSTLQETRATGYPNDLPVKSYDFNAPVKEYGQMSETYREIKRLAMFAHDFGSDICNMPYVEQPGNPLKPDNNTDLRSAVRYKNIEFKGKTVPYGFYFINNYQRRYEMAEHKNCELIAYDGDQKLATFPNRDILDKDYFFYTFNMPIGDALVTAAATPLCILKGAGENGMDAYVFYTDDMNENTYIIEGDLNGNSIITISCEDSLKAVKVMGDDDREHLLICDQNIVCTSDGGYEMFVEVSTEEKPVVKMWPDGASLNGFSCVKAATGQGFAEYVSDKAYVNSVKVAFNEVPTSSSYESIYSLNVSNITADVDEVYLNIDYAGDIANMVYKGKLIADSFYTGQKWEVGLKRFLKGSDKFDSVIVIDPLYEDTKVYLQEWPEMVDGKASYINLITSLAQFRIKLK